MITNHIIRDTGSYYDTIAWQKPIDESSWTTISGSYTLSYNGTLTELFMYVESPDPTLEYYIDDVTITPLDAPMIKNVVDNSTFENGSAAGWTGTGGCSVSSVSEEHHSGDYSLKTTGRTSSWMGPSYNLLGKIVPGKQYSVDFWVKYNSGINPTEQFKATVKATPTEGSPNYIQVNDPVTVDQGQWVEIKGTFTLPTGNYSGINIYVETPNPTLDFYIDDFTVTGEAASTSTKIQENIPDLHSVFSDYFPIGVAVEPNRLADSDPHSQLVAKHFNMLVAENAMKPISLEPTEGNFTFNNADAIVDFAIAHNMKMRGHTLLWHNQVPDWFFQDPSDPSKPASRDLLLQRLQTYITTVLNHFKTKYSSNNPIVAWDVVNEVLDDNGNLRNSKWLQIIGPDYIEKAFQYAHEADPNVKLFINDYNIENNGAKTQAMYNLVKKLKDEGIPVDGIGMQMHININSNVDNIKASIEKFASLGVQIQITELDMNMQGNVSQDALLRQARLYKQLFDVLKQEKQYITAVVFWGVSDDVTWLSQPNAPLLFDSNLQAKPAYWAIVDPNKAAVNRQAAQASQGSPSIGTGVDKDWITAKSLNVNTFVKGINGATAKVKTLWDSKNLYVLAQVVDNTPAANDSIELFVDKNGDKSTTYQPDDKHYIIYRDNSGSSDITHYVQSDEYGYTVQAAIPLGDVNPQVGAKIGFDVRVNDDKGSGTVDSIAVWNDYSNAQDVSTAYYGDLTLSKPSQITEAMYGTPTIDGKIDSIWDQANVINTNVWVQGTSGATAKVRTMWDNHYLYVLAEVTDSNLNKSSPNPYEQDSVEVFLDQNDHKTSYYENDDGQYRVNYDNEQSFGGSTNSQGFKSATSKTSTGYIVEEAIPFTAITPTDGQILGFDVQVNDADASGRRTSIVTWCDASGNSWQDTSGFGNLMLVDTRQLPRSGSNSNNLGDNERNSSDMGTVTKTADTVTLVLNEIEALNVVKNSSSNVITFDISNIGTTLQKVLEIPVSVLNAAKNLNKEIIVKSGFVSATISRGSLDLSNVSGNIKISIKDNGKYDRTSGFIPVTNALDVLIKAGNEDVKILKPLEITLDVPTSGINDLRKVGVYFYNEATGEWEYIGGKIDKDDNVITFEANNSSIYAAFEYDKTFADVKNHWAKDAIEVLASRHIAKGIDGKNFAPDKAVTRAEFAAMITRLLGIPEREYKGEFIDVKAGDWYANAIEAAYEAGIMLGDGKRMRPNDYITREEIAAISMRAFGKLTSYDEEQFSKTTFADDDRVSDWAKKAVANAKKAGIMEGVSGDLFAPKENATRAEAAVVIYRILDKSGSF
ncbi:endo-1,4-beta-xylanase [Caldanaerobius polysaccharolyticus]|uniref:endo-1,4-beta-xylanase n=1 Tax=Caldanaerobius polysaccharolyticus TaxID=44256 RepID=UPI0006921D87|nr:endo-1,4-beta-xylanase [Caldanaerobius polysaccharolyticus]